MSREAADPALRAVSAGRVAGSSGPAGRSRRFSPTTAERGSRRVTSRRSGALSRSGTLPAGTRRPRCSGSSTSTTSAGWTRSPRTTRNAWSSTGSSATRPAGAVPGWWPYPLSLRLRHWTRGLFRGLFAAEPARPRLLASIEAQAECLTDTLEVPPAREPPPGERADAEAAGRLLPRPRRLPLGAAGRRGARRRARRAVPPGRRPRRALPHVPRAAPPRPPRPRQRAARERRAAGAHPGAAARSPPLPGRHAPPGRRDRPRQRRGLRDRAGAGRPPGLRSTTRRRSACVRIGLLPGHGLPRLASRGRRLVRGRRADRARLPLRPRPRRRLLLGAEPRRAPGGGGWRDVHLRGR